MLTGMIFILLILMSGLFSATEIAFFSLRPARIRVLINSGSKEAIRVQKLLKKPEDLLVTILIGNNIVNTFTASLAAIIATNMVGSAGLGIATGVITLLILIFGEITPKAFAQKNNEWLAIKMAPAMIVLIKIFTPIVWFLNKITRIILSPFGSQISTENGISKDELSALSRLAHESGTVGIDEHNLIDRALKFSEHTIKNVFMPMHKVIILNGNTPIDQIAYFAAKSGHSRYPVYDDEQNNIKGYVHANDILRLLNSTNRDDSLLSHLRSIARVHIDDPIERVFRSMQRKHEHLALVVGNKRQPLGIVTLEDILEELVGEIEDEIDESTQHKNNKN